MHSQLKQKLFTFMDLVAYWRGRYGCSSPSKVLHGLACQRHLNLPIMLQQHQVGLKWLIVLFSDEGNRVNNLFQHLPFSVIGTSLPKNCFEKFLNLRHSGDSSKWAPTRATETATKLSSLDEAKVTHTLCEIYCNL